MMTNSNMPPRVAPRTFMSRMLTLERGLSCDAGTIFFGAGETGFADAGEPETTGVAANGGGLDGTDGCTVAGTTGCIVGVSGSVTIGGIAAGVPGGGPTNDNVALEVRS